MNIKNARIEDFDIAFDFIENLWDYNTYDREEVFKVYQEVIQDDNSFAFFIVEDGIYCGFCHGDFFNTFWMAGLTCYVSSIMTLPTVRGQGYGIKLMDHAKKLAKERHCKAMILDSGLPRLNAHQFYEKYGFEKSCYGFELIL